MCNTMFLLWEGEEGEGGGVEREKGEEGEGGGEGGGGCHTHLTSPAGL